MKNIKVLHTTEPDSCRVKISDALNYVLAETIFSPLNLPPFNQSAMDGYAIAQVCNSNFSHDYLQYKIAGEIKAGDKKNIKLQRGEAVRIFTGAAVPYSAKSVVMQEKVKVKSGQLFIDNYFPKEHENIRMEGSQIKKGEIALEKGTILNAAAIGFIASLGLTKISVFKKPVVSIIITGNELKSAGKKLAYGQIYESNSFTLNAALQAMNIGGVKIFRVKDDKKILYAKIKDALSFSDVLLISGGISVGKYDLVKECLEENGVKEIFYKVAQKPGKPLFVGKYEGGKRKTAAPTNSGADADKIIFALPGNPAATLVCFYEYVFPAIKKMLGCKEYFLPVKKMKIFNALKKKNDRSYFLKGKFKNSGVVSLDGQESYMLKSFAEADALIYLPMEKELVKKGEWVEVHILNIEH